MEYEIRAIKKEDEDSFNLYLKGPNAFAALYDIQQEIRKKWKYEFPEEGVWWEAYRLVNDIMWENGINLEEDYK